MFPRKELKREKSDVYMVTAQKSSLSLEGAVHLGTLKNLTSVHLSERW